MKQKKTKMKPSTFEQAEKGIVWMITDTASNMPVTIYSESLRRRAAIEVLYGQKSLHAL